MRSSKDVTHFKIRISEIDSQSRSQQFLGVLVLALLGKYIFVRFAAPLPSFYFSATLQILEMIQANGFHYCRRSCLSAAAAAARQRWPESCYLPQPLEIRRWHISSPVSATETLVSAAVQKTKASALELKRLITEMNTRAFRGKGEFASSEDGGLMNLCLFIDYPINYSFVASLCCTV